MTAIKHVIYQDGVTKRFKVMVTYIETRTFATEQDAEAWAAQLGSK